jgi:hypothetical protein
MGVTHHYISFPPTARPSFAAIERQVQVISGLTVRYVPEKMVLTCPDLHKNVALYEGEGSRYVITTFTREAGYLLVTAIVALQQLGGTFPASLPPWAGQAWRPMNKWAYYLRRNRILYPYPVEATW